MITVGFGDPYWALTVIKREFLLKIFCIYIKVVEYLIKSRIQKLKVRYIIY